MKMYLKKEQGKKMMTIKFEVEKLSISLFNLVTLIYETDLYPEWFPFCSKSNTVRIVY